MEKRRYVKRMRSEADRRKLHIFFTPAVPELRQHLIPIPKGINAIMERAGTKAEVKLVLEVLGRIRTELSNELKESGADSVAGRRAARALGEKIR